MDIIGIVFVTVTLFVLVGFVFYIGSKEDF